MAIVLRFAYRVVRRQPRKVETQARASAILLFPHRSSNEKKGRPFRIALLRTIKNYENNKWWQEII